jgi:ubiquinone biosynthesis protein
MRLTSIPQIYRHLNRWKDILAVLIKYDLAAWISRLGPDFTKDLLKAPGGASIARQRWETRLRLALSELGPTFIKLGQLLSTRPDIAGVALSEELQQLQANAPADAPELVRKMIETELKKPLAELFAEFEVSAMASASIGQVHRAVLHSGEKVVVKVLHTDIEKKVAVDMEILAGLAQLAEMVPEYQNFRPRAVVAEFQRAMRRELDFDRELRNLQQFARDFCDNPIVHIPLPHAELSNKRVLTMEMIEGLKMSEVVQSPPPGMDPAEIARRGAAICLEMIFDKGFYHADPHPGNIIVMENNVIGLLDFGMVGRIDEHLLEDLGEMLLALGDQDAEHLTSIIIRVGKAPMNLDRSSLAMDVTDFLAHYGSQPLDQFDLSGALREITEIIRRYNVMLPARIAMLLKALITLEGTSQIVSPKFSLVEMMQPYRRKILWQRLSPRRKLRKLRRFIAEIEHVIELLPRGISEMFEQMQNGRFDVHLDHRGLEPSVNRLVLGMLTSSLFLGSTLLLSRNVPPVINFPPLLPNLSAMGLAGCVLSIGLGLRLLRAINKSGHLDRPRKD